MRITQVDFFRHMTRKEQWKFIEKTIHSRKDNRPRAMYAKSIDSTIRVKVTKGGNVKILVSGMLLELYYIWYVGQGKDELLMVDEFTF